MRGGGIVKAKRKRKTIPQSPSVTAPFTQGSLLKRSYNFRGMGFARSLCNTMAKLARSTEYYAIAGLNYNSDAIISNDFHFEISTDFSTYSDIANELQEKTGYKLYNEVQGIRLYISGRNEDDNVVDFISQIGCSEGNGDSPNAKITFERIFVYIDCNNMYNFTDRLHGKIPHRVVVMDKVIEFLNVLI